jgi:Zn-dependent protease
VRVSRLTPEHEEHERELTPLEVELLEDGGFRGYEPIQPESTWRSLARKLWAPIAAVGALIAKFKFALLAVFKLKFFTVIGSMVVSAGVYVWVGGWWFGIGLVVLLFIHEMGHVVEAKRQGLPISAPVFIPMLGAGILMKRNPRDAWHEALNGIAGPIVGSLGAATIWVVGEAYDSRPLQALAFLGFFINLFNLIPALPLDGGRIAAALNPAVWFLGFVALIGLVVWKPNPLLFLILVFSAMELWRRWQLRHLPEAQSYYRVRPSQRLTIAVLYIGLAVLLVLGMHATHVPRDF